jgi:membrane protease YdiL (CAAX protease family)
MDFVAQAFKGKNNGYHYFFGVIFTFIFQGLGFIPLAIVRNFFITDKHISLAINPGIDNNVFFILIVIIPSAIGLWGLYLWITKIHKLPFLKVLTSRQKFDFQRVKYAFLILFITIIAFLIIDFVFNSSNYVLNFKPLPFFFLVLISFILLPLQTSSEEILFRGYLMQGFGVLTRSRLGALIITSTIFGLLHFANPEVEKLGYILLISYIGTGFFFGIVALMDEGIELTMGLHAANNIAVALFVTTNWSAFQTDALWINIAEPKIDWTNYVSLLVVYPIIVWIFSKKYAWTNWKQKLMGKVIEPVVEPIEIIND